VILFFHGGIMKFKLKCDELYKQVHACQRVIGSTTISPILANMYIEANESGVVSVIATDPELFYQGTMMANVEEPGAIMVPARNIVEVMATLPQSEEITIDTNEDLIIEITTENSGARYSLFGNSPEDFPSLPDISDVETFNFSFSAFKNMLNKVIYAVGVDEKRRELCGVLLQGNGKIFRMVGTDGRRLGLADLELKEEFESFEDVVVPAKVMKEINKFPDSDIDIEMKISRSQVVFKLDNIIYTSRLIEKEFPQYGNVIPDNKVCTIKVNTNDLLKNLRGVIPIAKEISFTIKCKFEENILEISALSSKIGKGVRKLAIENNGEPITISYNAKYLQECLNSINSEYIIFEPSSTVKATKIFPETQPEGELHENILMPVRTS
jgi:DNA polymerase-3 subunit beta